MSIGGKALLLSLLIFIRALPQLGHASNTWDGGGGDGNWTTNANWDNDAAPGYGTLTFTGTTRTTSTVNANYSMNMLLWTGTSNWTLNSSSSAVISLFDNGGTQAKIENQSSGLVTINAPITFAANNGSPPNPFGEINAVNGNITFGTSGTLTVNGASVNGIKFWGANGKSTTFNNTVSASGKWFGLTGTTGQSVIIGSTGNVTTGDFYVMNSGTLQINGGGLLTATALRLGGDYANTGNQNQALGGTLLLASSTGGQTFATIINSVAGNTSNALLVNSNNTSGTNTITGNTYLDSGLKFQNSSGGTLVFSGTTDIKQQAITFTPAGTMNVTGPLTSSSAAGGTLTMSGAGTLLLTNTNNSYLGTDLNNQNAGGTTISAGTLGIVGDTSLGVAPAGHYNNIKFTGNARLQDFQNNVTLAPTRDINIGGGVTVTLDSNGNTFTIGGNITASGTTGLTITGTGGTVVLTGTLGAIGLTTVSAGTLQIGDGTTSTYTLSNPTVSSTNKLVVNAGTTLKAGTVEVGLFSTASNVNATVSGTLNGNLLVDGTAPIQVSGNPNLSGYAKLTGATVTGTITDNGIVEISGTSASTLNVPTIATSSTFGALFLGVTASAGQNVTLSSGTFARVHFNTTLSNTTSNITTNSISTMSSSGTTTIVSYGQSSKSSSTAASNDSSNQLWTNTLNGGTWNVTQVGQNNSGAQAGGITNFVNGAIMNEGITGNQGSYNFWHGYWNVANGALNFNAANTMAMGNGGGGFMLIAANTQGGSATITGTAGVVFATGTAALGSNRILSGITTGTGGTVSFNGTVQLGDTQAWINTGTNEYNSVNLGVGGILSANAVQGPSTSGAGQVNTVNFNGGTLQARSSGGTLIQNLTTVTGTGTGGAYIFGGGGIIDTGTNNTTISQPLLAAGGTGITSIAISSGGTGYTAPPIVNINGGTLLAGGAPAQAIATVSGGLVTGIAIINPGQYSDTSTLQAVFTNPGYTSQATVGTISTAANTSGDLTKVGTGQLTLSGTSTYGGNTLIKSGTIALGGNSVLPSATNITLGVTGTGGTLDLNGKTQAITGLTFAGDQADTLKSGVAGGVLTVGTNGITVNSGAATQTIASANQSLVVSGSQNWNNNSANLLTVAANVAGNAVSGVVPTAFNGTGAGGVTVSGTIADGGGGGKQAILVNASNSATTLTAANTFTGGVTLQSGKLQIGNNAALGTGTATLTSGTLSSNSTTAYTLANPLSINGNVGLGDVTNSGTLTFSGNGTLNSGTQTLTVNSAVTVSGTLSNGGLVKAGSGVLSLSASNTITGGVQINAGTVSVTNAGGLGASGGVTLNSGTLQVLGDAGLTLANGNLTVTANSTLIADRATTGTPGQFYNFGTIGIGSQTLTVNMASRVNNTSTTETVTTGSVTLSGAATFALNNLGGGAAVFQVGSLNNNGNTLTLTGSGAKFAQAGGSSMTGNGGLTLDSNFKGTAELGGSNTFSGGVIANSGTLRIASTSGTGAGQSVAYSPTGTGAVTLANGVAVDNSASGNSWYAPTVNVSGTANLVGTNRLSVTFKTMELTSGTKTLNVDGKSLGVTSGNTLAGESTGLSQWEMANTTLLGIPVIQNGTLDLETTVFSGTNYGAMRINNGMNFTNADLIIGSNVLLMAANTGVTGTSALTSPNATVNGIMDLVASAGSGRTVSVKSLSGAGLVFGSMVASNTNGITLTLNGTSGSRAFSGRIADGPGTGALSLSKTGVSTQILSGSNTYSGGTTIISGTLQVGDGTGGSIQASSAVAVGAAGTLAVNQANGSTFGSTINNSGAINVIASGTNTLSGAISGVGTFTQSGAGTTILTASNSYNGGTFLTSGTLVAGHDYALGSGLMTLDGGSLASNNDVRSIMNPIVVTSQGGQVNGDSITFTGTAGGTGTLNVNLSGTAKTMTVNPTAGEFTPGKIQVSQGTLVLGGSNKIGNGTAIDLNGGTFNTGGYNETAGALTLSADSTIDFSSNQTGTMRFDSLGSYTNATTLTISNWVSSNTHLVVTNNPSITAATFLNNIQFGGGGYPLGANAIAFSDGNGNGYELVPVPEPATIIGAFTFVGLIVLRERRRLLLLWKKTADSK